MLNEADFTMRLEAAVALRKEREGREERSGVDHRKDKSQKKKDKKKKKEQGKHKRKPAFSKTRGEEEESEDANKEDTADAAMETSESAVNDDETSEAMDEEPPDINPCQSFFDNHTSETYLENLAYMQATYSFYLPDIEYCTDVEGFLGYCNEKVRLGNMCLYCQKTFASAESVLKHMKDKEHCKVRYERGVDQEEFEVFYDFEKANRAFLGSTKRVVEGGDAMEEGDDDGWEDVDSDEEADVAMKEGDEDDLYDAYQQEIATHGFDITPLGELIFPDGRIVGHRGLARYYKQRFAPDRTERTAVKHATEAAADRLYEGRVVNLYQLRNGYADENGDGTTAVAAMGRMAGSIPVGRNGRGILINGGGPGGFTSLSLYRYRAAMKKQRTQEKQGERAALRHRMNTNKMDKKHNNLMTGVCTAMMPR